jgi:hypothetical protein
MQSARLEKQTCRDRGDVSGRLFACFSCDGIPRSIGPGRVLIWKWLGLISRGPGISERWPRLAPLCRSEFCSGQRRFLLHRECAFLFRCCQPSRLAFLLNFRNEGKCYFKNLHHFFGPGTWVHDVLNRIVPSLGDFLYRIEYSHWNDFLLGPAIVSVLFPLAVIRIYRALPNQGSIELSASSLVDAGDTESGKNINSP